MRVPEQQRRPPRAHQGRGEHDVGRNHVRDDRVRRQRARKLALEPPDTLHTRGCSERPHLDVRGQPVTVARLCEDDHLVNPLGERTDLRDRRCEHRMGRIDALSEENEPPHIGP